MFHAVEVLMNRRLLESDDIESAILNMLVLMGTFSLNIQAVVLHLTSSS